MNKQTKMLIGVGAVAVAGYFIWKSTQKKSFASAIGSKNNKKMVLKPFKKGKGVFLNEENPRTGGYSTLGAYSTQSAYSNNGSGVPNQTNTNPTMGGYSTLGAYSTLSAYSSQGGGGILTEPTQIDSNPTMGGYSTLGAYSNQGGAYSGRKKVNKRRNKQSFKK
jgi:hypothetical protein